MIGRLVIVGDLRLSFSLDNLGDFDRGDLVLGDFGDLERRGDLGDCERRGDLGIDLD